MTDGACGDGWYFSGGLWLVRLASSCFGGVCCRGIGRIGRWFCIVVPCLGTAAQWHWIFNCVCVGAAHSLPCTPAYAQFYAALLRRPGTPLAASAPFAPPLALPSKSTHCYPDCDCCVPRAAPRASTGGLCPVLAQPAAVIIIPCMCCWALVGLVRMCEAATTKPKTRPSLGQRAPGAAGAALCRCAGRGT